MSPVNTEKLPVLWLCPLTEPLDVARSVVFPADNLSSQKFS